MDVIIKCYECVFTSHGCIIRNSYQYFINFLKTFYSILLMLNKIFFTSNLKFVIKQTIKFNKSI